MTETPPPTAKPGRWTRIALLVSLGINLAVLGLVAGLLVKAPRFGPGGEVGLWRYGHALPDPFRRDLAQALHAGRADWVGPRRDLRAQRASLALALTAEPYDPTAVAQVLATERALLSTLAERGTALLLAQIERMSPAERAAYSEALLQRPGPHRGRRN